MTNQEKQDILNYWLSELKNREDMYKEGLIGFKSVEDHRGIVTEIKRLI